MAPLFQPDDVISDQVGHCGFLPQDVINVINVHVFKTGPRVVGVMEPT